MTNQKLIQNLTSDEKMHVLKEALKSSRVSYNGKVFQVDTKQTIGIKAINILEKGLGLKLFCIEPFKDNIRITFEIKGVA